LENKLRNLYSLQIVDNALDELEELKGDLPSQKRELEDSLTGMETARNAIEMTMKDAFSGREKADDQIVDLREKLERFKKQQLDVRNNREYDALTREMDHATATILRLEREVEALEGKGVMAKNDLATMDTKLEELRSALMEKETALAEISKENEQEELKYRHEREKLLARIDKDHLMAYERIRKAKRGRAIVPVKRGSCGGCFAKVPPQRILEIRQNDKIHHCEHCGRIIISDEIVETTSTEA
jgi:predicted  nucleic acid-binding Zn-ribbon protein